MIMMINNNKPNCINNHNTCVISSLIEIKEDQQEKFITKLNTAAADQVLIYIPSSSIHQQQQEPNLLVIQMLLNPRVKVGVGRCGCDDNITEHSTEYKVYVIFINYYVITTMTADPMYKHYNNTIFVSYVYSMYTLFLFLSLWPVCCLCRN